MKTHLREAFREFFDMPTILAPLTKLLPEPEKVHRRSYDGLRCPHEWPDVFTIRAEFENFFHRVSILWQLRHSVTPALRWVKNETKCKLPLSIMIDELPCANNKDMSAFTAMQLDPSLCYPPPSCSCACFLF